MSEKTVKCRKCHERGTVQWLMTHGHARWSAVVLGWLFSVVERQRKQIEGSTDMAVSQRTQAFQQAGAAVASAIVVPGESLEDIAERFVRSADPHQVTGRRGEVFDWSFGYGDVPEIVAEARKILASR